MRYVLLTLTFILFSMSLAFGQDVPEPVQSIGDKILSFLESAGGAAMAIALGLEFLFRSVKSKKPLGLIRSISATLRYSFKVILSILDFVDRVLPQNVEEKLPLKKL